jgi:Acyltransferase family
VEGGDARKPSALLPPVRSVAEGTSPDRDRLLDAVRAFALLVVVFGHLLMAVVYWPSEGGEAQIGNLMASYPALQYLTWLLQVMPLFFAFGGAASVIAWRKADSRDVLYSAWMWGRVRRLLRPVLVYLAVMAVFSALMTLVLGPDLDPLLSIVNGPLWFLGVYTVTLLFLPFMWWVHHHNRAIAFVVLLPLAILDSVGVTVLGWPLWLGFFNYLLCWLAIQQLGFFWGEDTRRRTWVVVAVVTFVVNAALVYFGPWPMSLVGLPGDVLDYDGLTLFGHTYAVPGFHGEYSNMAPPSVVLLLHGLTLVSLVFIARRPLTRFLHRPRVWLVTTLLTLTAMSLYIWHLLAIVLSLTTLRQLGLPPPTRLDANGFPEPVDTAGYALWFVGFLAVFLAYLAVLVLLTWSTQYRPLPLWDRAPRHPLLPARAPGWTYVLFVVVSGVLVGAGILVVSLIGFAGFPLHNAEWSGITMNALLGVTLLLAGSLTMRALSCQRPAGSSGVSRPPRPDQRSRRATAP